MKTKSFIPELNSLSEIHNFIKQLLIENKFDPDKMSTIDLVIEEIVINIINHGIKDTKDGSITIGFEIRDKKKIIEICDNGIRFNPLQKEDPDIDEPLATRKPGGLGIFLVKQFTEQIDYSYKNKLNILRIILT